MPDVDIEFYDRDGVLKLFKHTPATIIKDNKTDDCIVVVQIAGLIARRIVTQTEKSQTVSQGQRLGMIRFGSRVDIYFKNKNILVKQGQNVVAGESLIAAE